MDDNNRPVAPELEQLLSTLDDNLEPIKKEEDESTEPSEDVEENTETEQTDEDEESSEDGDSDAGGDKDNEDKEDESKAEDDGYAIDEGEPEEEAEDAPSVSTAENKTNPNLTPEENYILDNLSPITVRGMVNDKEVTLEVLAPEQLPAGFNFADQREQAIALKQFGMLEQRATQLQTEFRTQENAKAAQQFKVAEDAADRADIGELQRTGDIPKFKAAVDSKDFDSDPAAQLIQSVLDFKEQQNVKYLENYQQGKAPYRHIGFEEAFLKYQRSNPDKTRSTAQKTEDAERKGVARKATRSTGTESSLKQDNVRITSSRDLFAYIDGLE